MRSLCIKAAAALVASASGAAAEQVMERIEVHATPEEAWAAIGDFCGIKDWHPSVVSCDLQGDGKTKLRTLILRDGAKILEKETSWNDVSRSYSYKILESPLPVESYSATFKVLPMDKTRIYLLWTSSFKPIGPAPEAQKVISEIYAAGLKSLKEKLETSSR